MENPINGMDDLQTCYSDAFVVNENRDDHGLMMAFFMSGFVDDAQERAEPFAFSFHRNAGYNANEQIIHDGNPHLWANGHVEIVGLE